MHSFWILSLLQTDSAADGLLRTERSTVDEALRPAPLRSVVGCQRCSLPTRFCVFARFSSVDFCHGTSMLNCQIA